MDNLIDFILEDANKVLQNVDLRELEGKRILITGASGLMDSLDDLWKIR